MHSLTRLQPFSDLEVLKNSHHCLYHSIARLILVISRFFSHYSHCSFYALKYALKIPWLEHDLRHLYIGSCVDISFA